MTVRLFRSRWHRVYFELLESFAQSRCALCFLLSNTEQGLVADLFGSRDQNRQSPAANIALCAAHRRKMKAAAADGASIFTTLKNAVRDSLDRVSHSSKSAWKRSGWFAGNECEVCSNLFSKQKFLSRALVRFLEDSDFWKAFQGAPLLCLEHLKKCLAMASKGKGFQRLLDDQRGKLSNLLNDLIRFEATGNYAESQATAIAWWADFVGPQMNAAIGESTVAEHETPQEVVSDSDNVANAPHDQEKLLFENEKLNRKVHDLLDRLNDVESRAASLHYRVAELIGANKRLEMAYTGASTQANGLTNLVRELTDQVRKLKEGKEEDRRRVVS